MPYTYRQLAEYVKLVGAHHLIAAPTSEEKQAYEGFLFIRGLANVSLIMELSAQ